MVIRPYEIILVAGPNGAGKTNFARQFLPAQLRHFDFVNADEIARTMGGHGLTRRQLDMRAGREMLNRIRRSITFGDDLMIETTLSSKNWARHVPNWQAAGYSVCLYYLRLPSADMAVSRVKRRVANGGHDIPEPDIRRRFQRSLEMLEQVYKPVVDEWYVFDSLENRSPILTEQSRS